MNGKKKWKASDIMMDCIIGGVALVLLIVLMTTVFKGAGNKDTGSDQKVATKNATEQPEATEQTKPGDLRYECVISGEQEGTNDTTFVLLFHTDRKTYEEAVQVAGKTSQLDKGSYEKKGESFVTKSDKGKESITYTPDDKYLIATSDVYRGEIPDDDTFDAICTYEKAKEFKKTITFKKDGTYKQTLVSYAKEGSSEKDSTATTTGKYQRKGKFIQRTSDQKESLMDFYVYNNQISDAYYQIAE